MSKTRRTAQEMFPLIERYFQGNMTQKAFCTEQGISLPQLNYWRAKYRRAAAQKPQAFIEIRPDEPQERALTEVVYPHGVRLRLFALVEPSYLEPLLQVEASSA